VLNNTECSLRADQNVIYV